MTLLSRTLVWSIAVLLGAAGPVWAETEDPFLEIRTRRLGDVLATVKTTALEVLSGQSPSQQRARASFEAGWNALIGEHGKQLLGVDVDRPVAAYAYLREDLAGVFLAIPVSDEVLFRQWLENMGLKFQPQGDWFEVALPGGLSARVRFADKYAHVAVGDTKVRLPKDGPNAAATAKVLARPAQTLISGELLLDRIPAPIRNAMVQGARSTKGDERRPNEKLAHYVGRSWAGQWFGGFTQSVFNELEAIELSLDVTPANRVAAALTCRPKEGTPTAQLAVAGRSQFASVTLPGKTLGAIGFHGPWCQSVKDGLGNFAEITFLGVATKNDDKNEPDPAVMGLYRLLAAHLGPAPFDVRLDVSAAESTVVPTCCVRIGLAKGATFENELAALAPQAPTLKLDVARSGEQRIHALQLSAQNARTYPPGALRRTLQQKMYFAITPDALLAVVGGDGLATLERALQAKLPADAAPTPQMHHEIQIGPTLTLLAAYDETLELPKKFAAVREAYAGKDDRVLLIAGDPAAAERALTVRFELSLPGAAMLSQFVSLQLEQVLGGVSTELKP